MLPSEPHKIDDKARGGTPKKIGSGCAARFPKVTKLCDFPHSIYDQFMTWPKIWYRISYQNGGKVAKIDNLFMTTTTEKLYPLGPQIPILPL